MSPKNESHLPVVDLLAPDIAEMIQQRRMADLRAALSQLQYPELADLLTLLDDPHHRMIVFRIIGREKQAEAFSRLEADQQESLLADLSNTQAAQLLDDMAPDDRAGLLDELPGNITAKLLALLNPAERRRTQFLLGYPVDSVGRLMTPNYVALSSHWTITRALEHIRKQGKNAETVAMLFVVDPQGKLIDDLPLHELLLNEPDSLIGDICDNQYTTLRATDDQERAVRLMNRYDIPALPVVTDEGVLVGIVTFDDVADIAQEETTEDIQKMGGMKALDEPYLTTPLLQLVRNRGTWLTVLFFGQLLTASALTHYEDKLKIAYVLTMFLPLIISSGGNCGSQAATLIIRAMALQQITLRNWFAVLRRELICGCMLGLLLGVLGLVRILLWQYLGWADYSQSNALDYKLVAITVGVAIVGVVMWGSLTGGLLPILIKRLGLDPATISTPFIATLVDVTGLVIYFNAAIWILQLH